jgi:hypothetical protein
MPALLRNVAALYFVDGYSRWTNRSAHLCSKTVRATFMAHGSSVMRPLSSGIPPAVYNSWGDL